ncbi:hypothetical protein EUGRSUZ_E03630 [Eucalyptus grandis]|uniref:non-specific serine/threonine protein kinase n=2 Tax=Eucalyptus grandis TaxID=71139 RepID=A0A059C9N7_EUCGR|nr:hypothetical protein EUGRSUZ_E03630 [Eucalyptus grandis]
MSNRMIFSTSSLKNFPLGLLMFFLSFHVLHCYAVYQITPSQPLFQNQTLMSSSQIFELGFFTPNSSQNHYIGMRYKNMSPSKIIWVANRDNPLSYRDSYATLTIGSDGSLKLLDGQQNIVWSINVSIQTKNAAAVLMDTGNFVLQDVHSGNYFWEKKVKKWETDWEAPRNRCETYGTCGPFGVCNAFVSPICSCLKGFTPKMIAEWNKGNWTTECVRERELICQKPNYHKWIYFRGP